MSHEGRRWAGSPALPLERAAEILGVPLDETARSAARRLPLRFPGEYLSLADPQDPADPIRAIAWPNPEELLDDPEAIADPVGESRRRLHRLVIQKHPDRALLLVTSRCHFYCRFCFRAGDAREPSPGELEEALACLGELEGLREVLLSGGDPLVLGNGELARLFERLAALPELRTVRVHTRAPIHDPARIDDELVETLAAAPLPVVVVVHATHPRELRDTARGALGRLRRAGIPLYSQTVLLRGVNDDAERLATLFAELYAEGVRPYYLHHPDRVAGTARFRVSIERGRAIARTLRGHLPGPAQPSYVLDLPDGAGKVPVDWLVAGAPGAWTVSLPDGSVHHYVEPEFERAGSGPGSP